MKQLIGEALLLIGILGFVTLLAIGAYSIFGWIGSGIVLSLTSFIVGMVILDEYED